MKRLVQALLICAAGPALAGPETLLSCTEGHTTYARWSAPGATVVCHQSVAGGSRDTLLYGGGADKMVAFQNNVLLGIREPDGTISPNQENAWVETGSTGVPGELWWGKSGIQPVFIGQLSIRRLTKLSAVPPALRPALNDYMMRVMMATMQKQPVPYKPGDENFMLFQRKVMNYTQLATTTVDFRGGNGSFVEGPDYIPSAKATNARLELQTRPVIKGMLKFDLVVDGQNRHFEIPMLAGNERDPLRARMSGEDGALACAGVESSVGTRAKNACIAPNGVSMGVGGGHKELFDATGAFFGDHTSLVALQFNVMVNSPSRNRTGALGRGVLILKAQ